MKSRYLVTNGLIAYGTSHGLIQIPKGSVLKIKEVYEKNESKRFVVDEEIVLTNKRGTEVFPLVIRENECTVL